MRRTTLIAVCALLAIAAGVLVIAWMNSGSRSSVATAPIETAHASEPPSAPLGEVAEPQREAAVVPVDAAESSGNSSVRADVEPASGAISGHVVDEHGVGLANADVRAFDDAGDCVATTTTGASGGYRLVDVPAGQIRVRAKTRRSEWTSRDPITVRAGGEAGLEIVVHEIELDDLIALRVIDPDGAPVPSAQVWCSYKSGAGSGTNFEIADERGECTVHLVQRVPHDFEAKDPLERFRPARTDNVEPGTLDLVLRLAPSRKLHVLVRDHDGVSIDYFRAEISDRDRHQTFIAVKSGMHDEGRAEFQLPVSVFDLSVDAPGFALGRLEAVDPANVPAELVVELSELPGVRGTVRGYGAVIAGAHVTLHGEVRADRWLKINGLRTRYELEVIGEQTAKDGTFTLLLRESGRYYLRAEAEGWAAADSGPFNLDALRGAERLDIELTHGGAIAGRALTLPDEDPAKLIVVASRGDGFAVTTRPDAQGDYRFDALTPGRWWIGRHDREIRARGSTAYYDVQSADEIPWNCVVVDGATTRFDVPMGEPDRVRLSGLLSLGGKPPSLWRATLMSSAGRASFSRDTPLTRDGRFEFSVPAPGNFELWLRPTKNEPGAMNVQAGLTLHEGANEFELDLPMGRIEGRFAALDSSAQLNWQWDGSDAVTVGSTFSPQSDGSFVLDAVPAGRVRLKRHDRDLQRNEVLAEVDVTVGATTRVDK